MKELILPEYGRNIQNMVEIAMKIEDRSERNRCARSIINCMGNLFPYLRDNDAFQHKLWDHLALMSNFELDIDYPFEITPAEEIHPTPEAIPLPNNQIRERHYGRFIDNFITVHEILQARILEWVAIPFSRGIFPTQGLNPGLLHDRRILYSLSH